MPEGQTEEEYGHIFWIIAFVQASSRVIDFAIPLPTSLSLGHLLPGRRFFTFIPGLIFYPPIC